ncbi:MAG: exo-alpha-sialidase [Anaerolineae bacterium]|nr:exo-alpha-sialidase [Anaerolineae bacterium]
MHDQVPRRHETLIAPTGPGNPRNGEGAIVPLRDGRLLLGWTHFTGGGQDHAAAEIWGRTSSDGGFTWDAPALLQENVGQCNVMSVGFLRLRSGALLFGYAVKHHPRDDCRYYVRRSYDEGQTWDPPVLATSEAGYFVVNNDRLLQTGEGRLLVPAAKSIDADYHCVSTCFCSDDEGQTWRRCAPYLDLPGGPVGLQEPGIVECAGGELWMYARTDRGRIYASWSRDGGEQWSDPAPTELVAPAAPASARRLPGSDAILILYNDRRGVAYSADRSAPFHHRTPLAAAVSHDGGRTWGHHRLVERDRSRSYCYASIAFYGADTLLTYYVGVAGGPNLLDLKLCIVPTAAWTSRPPL